MPQRSTGETMNATTNLPVLVTPPLSRHRAVAQLRDALRRLWSHTKRPQRDGAVTSIAKGILTSERFKGLDHVVAMQFDAIERETPIEVVEEFWKLGRDDRAQPSTPIGQR
jgi:hypothetical protein